jgi:hypothetical protein
MSVVLVVTRNPTITLALAGAGHDIVELRPAGVDAWLQREDRPEPDAVVVAQPGPEESLATLYAVRDHGVGAAALLLASGGDAWAAIDPLAPGGSPATRLLTLPVGGAELVAAVNDVIARPDAYVGTHVATPDPLPEPGPIPDQRAGIDPFPGRAEPAVSHVIDLRAGEADEERVAKIRDAVRQVLDRSDEVYGVPESAAVVVAEAKSRVRADAASIVIPDGDRWRPTADEGVADHERGEILAPSSWLISTMAPARRGLVIEADLARERLQGIPLAGRRHLVVAPVPPGRAVLVLARDEDPGFGEDDVAKLVELGVEAGPLLSAALDARDLARALAPLRDIEPLPDRVDSSS